jgi:MoaA/NifB/PqqE/SkfB family radical SAM enzyme
MMSAVALIRTDLDANVFGLRARLGEKLGGPTVLAQTVRRVARVAGVEQIVLVHPAGQAPLALLKGVVVGKPVVGFAYAGGLRDADALRWASGRKWALSAWRGGLGSATVYDELFSAGALAGALEAHGGGSALLAGADWCLIDPQLSQQVLELHVKHAEAMKVTFTQAPPGLCGIATNLQVLRQLRDHHASFGNILGYNPIAPTVDPIGREVNHPIAASVRDCNRRFIYDLPRSIDMMTALAEELGEAWTTADARRVTDACRAMEGRTAGTGLGRLPQQVRMELTPRRVVMGPIVPQHEVAIDRAEMDVELARKIVEQLGDEQACGDAAVLLGGLGDALLHPKWDEIAQAAHQAGVLGVGIETDLLCEGDELKRILDCPLDLVTVRLNADSAATYQKVMGADLFKTVIENLQWLMNHRNRGERMARGANMPWIVPRMVKTSETLKELESFFDKWTMVCGHAVLEPATTGCGLMGAQSPVPMEPPLRKACRQLGSRMSILSDGRVVLCDQDWLARAVVGDAREMSLVEIWRKVRGAADIHREGRFAEVALCAGCTEWHRP